VPLSKRLTFRLTPAEFERLEALAKAREVNLGRCVRQLVAEADVDQPARPRDALSEEAAARSTQGACAGRQRGRDQSPARD
jgi:hypothetical protein